MTFPRNHFIPFLSLVCGHLLSSCFSSLRLFIEKLPKHPEYSKAPATDKSRLKKLIKQAMPRAMELKEKLKEKYEKEKEEMEKIMEEVQIEGGGGGEEVPL